MFVELQTSLIELESSIIELKVIFNTIRELLNLIRVVSNYTYIESSLIDLKCSLIRFNSSFIELESPLIQEEIPLNISVSVNFAFHMCDPSSRLSKENKQMPCFLKSTFLVLLFASSYHSNFFSNIHILSSYCFLCFSFFFISDTQHASL